MEAFTVVGPSSAGTAVGSLGAFAGSKSALRKLEHQQLWTQREATKVEADEGSWHQLGFVTGGGLFGLLNAAIQARRNRKRATATLRRQQPQTLSGPTPIATQQLLAPEDEWIRRLDIQGFGKDVRELGQRLMKEQGEADVKHLHKIVNWSNFCAFVGLATMWMPSSIISIIFLSLWTHSRWTMIAHHSSHGGYTRTDASGRFSGKTFAIGSLWKRARDWFDWFLPEAWDAEHNDQHHMKLGEDADPDLVERNVEDWKESPMPVRLALTVVSLLTWKWSYYASNTYKELKLKELRKNNEPLPKDFDPLEPITISAMMKGRTKGLFSFGELFQKVLGPYLIAHFVLLPAPLLLFGTSFFCNAVFNLLCADLLTNLHAFIVIGTNHCGNDMYRFGPGCKAGSPTFYLRAVTSSVNFRTGGDVNDFFHGFLNYQIEHHAWPHLSMLAYQKGQPELKAICAKYGVPYVQESVFIRAKKTIDVMLGLSKMRRYPIDLEHKPDLKAVTA